MVRIYALKDGDLVLYVGRTTLTLHKRASHHRTPTNKTHSRYIPKWIEWEIVLLEECADDFGIAREQFYYDTLKPLYNKCRPGQTDSEYWRTEAQKLRKKIFNQTDKGRESHRAACRAYRARKKAQLSSIAIS